MVEATDRPEAESTAATDTGTDLLSSPGGETYRPLSLLAVLGFSLAAFYALVLGVGTLSAFVNRTPWLMPTWTVLWPLLALALCWVARTQIQGSEGTLSGLPLTTWGAGLSVSVGVLYWSYYAATAFAIRQQATHCAEEWINLIKAIKKGDSEKDAEGEFKRLAQAFLMTLPPTGQRVDDPKFRETLEGRYNVAPNDPNGPGQFTGLTQSDFFRYLEEAGDSARVTFVRVDDWSDKASGYVVRCIYRVETPIVAFDLAVTANGIWPRGATTRQWYIEASPQQTGPARDTVFEFTPEGKLILEQWSNDKVRGARAFVQNWTESLLRGDTDRAYFATLTPEERRRLLGRWRAAATPLAFWTDASVRKTLLGKKHQDFLEGQLVSKRADFYTVEGEDQKVLDGVKACFTPTLGRIQQGTVFNAVPSWHKGEDVVQFSYGAHLLTSHHVVEVRIKAEAERKSLDHNDADPWRITAVELVRARPKSESRQGPRPMPLPKK